MAQMPAKRFVDIEACLHWAYRDELPKRDRAAMPPATSHQHVWSPYLYPAGYGDTSPMFRDGIGGGPSGGYVEGWSRDPGFPRALGGPHPDAVAIEQAVENLASWAGHSFGADDPAGLMHGFDPMALRTYIGTAEKEIPKVEVDHVAAGMAAVANMAAIVAVHARMGSRPKWTRELPESFLVTGANGKPKVLSDETFVEVYDKKRDRTRFVPASELDKWPENPVTHVQPVPCRAIRKGRYPPGAYHLLDYRPRPAALVAERAEWAAWRMGLDLVHQALEGRLQAVAPLPPAAPWRPWAGEGELHGRPPQLFTGLRDEPYRRGPQTREQAAEKRRAARRRQLSDRGEEVRPVRAAMPKRQRGPDVA